MEILEKFRSLFFFEIGLIMLFGKKMLIAGERLGIMRLGEIE